jgi:hypothetical protein
MSRNAGETSFLTEVITTGRSGSGGCADGLDGLAAGGETFKDCVFSADAGDGAAEVDVDTDAINIAVTISKEKRRFFIVQLLNCADNGLGVSEAVHLASQEVQIKTI